MWMIGVDRKAVRNILLGEGRIETLGGCDESVDWSF